MYMSASKLSRFRLHFEKVGDRNPLTEARRKRHKLRDVEMPRFNKTG